MMKRQQLTAKEMVLGGRSSDCSVRFEILSLRLSLRRATKHPKEGGGSKRMWDTIAGNYRTRATVQDTLRS
eukprot:5285096-Amphidinium_carterae.1